MMKRTTLMLAAALALPAHAGTMLLNPYRHSVSPGSGNIVVTWQAPLRDGDNADLSDLNGYVAYCGTSRGAYSVNSGALSSSTLTYTFNSLASGTWYCTVTAKDSGGNESFYAVEATKVVP